MDMTHGGGGGVTKAVRHDRNFFNLNNFTVSNKA